MSYQCPTCSKKYEYKHTLARHIHHKHKDVLHDDSRNENSSNKNVKDYTTLYRAPEQLPVSEDRVGEKLEFEHPFSMIVAGPSRSGKTHWVIDLLVNMETRIVPTPASITYCYAHWQKKYDYLKENDPSVQFYEGLPSTAHFKTLSNAIVVFDDLMDASMGNQNMMNMFTEKNHHQNISVILMMQNLEYICFFSLEMILQLNENII